MAQYGTNTTQYGEGSFQYGTAVATAVSVSENGRVLGTVTLNAADSGAATEGGAASLDGAVALQTTDTTTATEDASLSAATTVQSVETALAAEAATVTSSTSVALTSPTTALAVESSQANGTVTFSAIEAAGSEVVVGESGQLTTAGSLRAHETAQSTERAGVTASVTLDVSNETIDVRESAGLTSVVTFDAAESIGTLTEVSEEARVNSSLDVTVTDDTAVVYAGGRATAVVTPSATATALADESGSLSASSLLSAQESLPGFTSITRAADADLTVSYVDPKITVVDSDMADIPVKPSDSFVLTVELPRDITSNDTVVAQIGDSNNIEVTVPTQIESEEDNQVGIPLDSVDLDAGVYELEFEITYADGTVENIPAEGYEYLSVNPEL
jgi:hypothetical protein